MKLVTGFPKPPGRKGLFHFVLSRDGVRTRDLRRDGRGSSGRTADSTHVGLGVLFAIGIVIPVEFCFRYVLLLERRVVWA